jgi:hypothetical protein
MGAFAFRRDWLPGGVVLAVAVWVWPTTGWSYTADEQQACSGDAFRLCSSEIPDVTRVGACMARRQAELSPACRVYFRPEHPPAKSQKAQKPRKPRKHSKSGR